MNKKSNFRTLCILCIIFLTLWAVVNLSALRLVAEKAIAVLIPLLAGACIAFILNIPLRFVERLWIKLFSAKRRGLRRAVSIALCLLISVGAIALIVGTIIPQIWSTGEKIIAKIPFYIERINSWYTVLANFLTRFSITLPSYHFNGASLISTLRNFLSENSHHIIDTSVTILTTAFGMIFDGIFAIVIAVYILAQKERLGAGVRKLLYSIFSEKNTERLVAFARLSEKTFSGFVTGQLTEALILGVLCFVGMLIFNIPYPLLVSALIGITALIPIFGAFIGAGFGALLILLESPVKALIFIVFIIILQQIEGNVIYPRVVGSQVGLPGLWVLVAVTIGSEFGILGMLLAVPIVSLIYTVVGQIMYARIKEKGLEAEFPEPQKKTSKKKRKKAKDTEQREAEDPESSEK